MALNMDQKLLQRSQQNWRYMLDGSTDAAHLVEYEVSQLLSMLLAKDRPLDTTAVHSVRVVGGLFDVVYEAECSGLGLYPGALERVERSLGGLLEFLVRCFNTRETPFLLEVEAGVIALLYNLSAIPPSAVTHEQVAPFVPFLLHAAYVSLQDLLKDGAQTHIFGLPPPKLVDGLHLHRGDQHIWLAVSACSLVDPAYFSGLLGFAPTKANPLYGADERELQLAYIYEHMQLTLFYLNRAFEAVYAVPLHIYSPAKRGSAEPKVNPHKVLSFLIDPDAPLIPPVDYEDASPDDQDGAAVWVYDADTVDMVNTRLLYAFGVLNHLAPVDQLTTSDKPLARPKPAQIIVLYVKLVVGCLNWLSVTLLAALHNSTHIDDGSSLLSLWRCVALTLARTIAAFPGCVRLLPVDTARLLTMQLVKGCLHLITIDQAFAAYHPQGSLSVAPVAWEKYIPPTIARDAVVNGRPVPCGQPLLLMISVAQTGVPYAALAGHGGMAAGARPPLEQCIATFLHTLFQTHLRVAECSSARMGAAGSPVRGREPGIFPPRTPNGHPSFVPVQNIFRGIYEVLQGMTHSQALSGLCHSRTRQGGGRVTDSLSPNWIKACEIAKGFAMLPFGEVVQGDVEAVSKNAFTLVHYFLQLSIPCAPTAPPTQISTRGGRGWDDYEGYFQEMDMKPSEPATAASMRLEFPPSFGLTDDKGAQGYRLKQLLSSHLRGILSVVPFFRILFIVNRRAGGLEQCAYYCSSVADLISYSAHNHGVAVPFLRTSLECYEKCQAQKQALSTLEKIEKIFLSLMDTPSAALAQKYSTFLASRAVAAPREETVPRTNFRRHH